MSETTVIPGRLFRKKPVVIEAWLLDGSYSNAVEIHEWSGKAVYPTSYHVGQDRCWRVSITTLEGTMSGEVGDWIIRGVAGEFYPCKPDIFEATYEAVS